MDENDKTAAKIAAAKNFLVGMACFPVTKILQKN